MPTVYIHNYFVIFDPGFPLDFAFLFPYHDDWVIVTSQQGRSLDVSLVIDPQGQNKKARVLSASYEIGRAHV